MYARMLKLYFLIMEKLSAYLILEIEKRKSCLSDLVTKHCIDICCEDRNNINTHMQTQP